MHAKPPPPPPPPRPPIVWQPIPVAAGAGPLGVYVLEDPDALLDTLTDTSFVASDERMPYYALLWPSGEALAVAVAEGPSLAGLSVLDLGCGVGAVGLAATRRGARVTYLDWAPEAEDLVRLGAMKLDLPVYRFVEADWRSPPATLGRFDRILAADVLYEARNAVPVARFLAAHLTDTGEAWLADPGRLHARDFPELAPQHGLVGLEARQLPCRESGGTITLYRIARAGRARE